jgi:lipopolysaccharide/colanic/teichoic acid biosynthesis glycosyltransferase
MALVGPRPEDPGYVDPDDPAWRDVLAVLPGITGAAQLRFHDEDRHLSGDTDAQYRHHVLPAKLQIDRDYVRHQSIGGDLRLLAETVAFALGRGRER